MSLPVPKLDNVEFETLFESARALIPTYAPEWTDHNTHDPGITLLELIAFLVDQDVYQAGFVSDAHFESFAALLGVERRRARPAHGVVWPPEQWTAGAIPNSGVILPRGAKTTSPDVLDLGYQTSQSITLTPAKILHSAGQSTDNSVVWGAGPATGHNRIESFNDMESNRLPDALEIVLDQPLLTQLPDSSDNYTWDTLPPMSLGIALNKASNTMAIASPDVPRHGKVILDYRIDETGQPWWRTTIEEDSTDVLHESGVVLFKLPLPAIEAGKLAVQNNPGQPLQARIRLRTQGRVNPISPALRRIQLNVLPIEQLTMVPRAPFSKRSFGQPDETFDIELQDLPEGHKKWTMEVGEQNSISHWEEIPDLSDAGPEDKVFQVDYDNNQIRFGNSLNGRIPPKDAQVIHPDYQLTKGAAGNQIANLSWRIAGAPPLAGNSLYGYNPDPVSAGEEAWTLRQLRAKARRWIQHRQLLLTNEELANAALALPGLNVKAASVVVGYFSYLNCRPLPGSRTLVVTPDRRPEQSALIPTPPDWVAAVAKTLKPRQALGERLLVMAPRRVPVRVKASLQIEDGVDAEGVISAAMDRLNARLTDLPTHPDDPCDTGDVASPAIEPWPLGRPVTRLEMKSLIAAVEGVMAITDCKIARGQEEFQIDDIKLGPIDIAIGTDHQLVVMQSEDSSHASLSGHCGVLS